MLRWPGAPSTLSAMSEDVEYPAEIAILLDPSQLHNPDLDIRYVIPETLVDRAPGLFLNNGYDYVKDSKQLLLFLRATDLTRATTEVVRLIENEKVLENDLRLATVVAVRSNGGISVIFPSGYKNVFPWSTR